MNKCKYSDIGAGCKAKEVNEDVCLKCIGSGILYGFRIIFESESFGGIFQGFTLLSQRLRDFDNYLCERYGEPVERRETYIE